MKSKCAGTENDATSENVGEDQVAATPFTDSYDIATKRFQDIQYNTILY